MKTDRILEERKFSKVGGKLCTLKTKIFSSDSQVKSLPEDEIPQVKEYSTGETKVFSGIKETPKEKTYSVTTIRERLRYAKYSMRMRFRRLLIDYKKFYEMQGDRLSDEDFRILRGLFISDIMNIMNTITPEVLRGKQINTLLGLSAFGKELRVAGSALQLPYRLAMKEEERIGAPSKKRYQDIQKAYNEFVKALLNYVFKGRENPVGLTEAMGTAQATENQMD